MKKVIKKALVLSVLAVFTGCAPFGGHKAKPFSEKHDIIQTLNSIQQITKREFYYEEDISDLNQYSYAGYYGPSMKLNEYEYTLLRYSGKDTLFANNGIEDRLPFLLRKKGDINYLNFVAKKFKYKDISSMFKSIYLRMNTENTVQLSYFLKRLEKDNMIDLKKINKKAIHKKSKEIYNSMYGIYRVFEGDKSNFNDWVFTVDGEKQKLTLKDYKPYALTLLILEDLIDAQNKKGDK